uniref:Uncharacterized protein n=1 Tax=Lepeophtheirus salmonis TaxID=72036 RepID=A0A0K2SXC0_LEPSM
MLKGYRLLVFVLYSGDIILLNGRILHGANALHIKVYDSDFRSRKSLPLCSRIHKFFQIFYEIIVYFYL